MVAPWQGCISAVIGSIHTAETENLNRSFELPSPESDERPQQVVEPDSDSDDAPTYSTRNRHVNASSTEELEQRVSRVTNEQSDTLPDALYKIFTTKLGPYMASLPATRARQARSRRQVEKVLGEAAKAEQGLNTMADLD
ncbi:hypothetical protein VP1G_00800 [Cytospora mali]|uniref:Uncharacterized protein n=1 Tax=Cytospora mali TaxID=578113 RepID=A0A194UNF2_CYTMA|nr:hypothetical protein VP1G_00800 [Valsa mali var. pyri (nom. inval.)]